MRVRVFTFNHTDRRRSELDLDIVLRIDPFADLIAEVAERCIIQLCVEGLAARRGRGRRAQRTTPSAFGHDSRAHRWSRSAEPVSPLRQAVRAEQLAADALRLMRLEVLRID